jgi:hypothetical protein
MDEYISKEFMLKNLEADKIHNAEHCEPVTVQIVELFIRYVKEFPAADVQPVKHGKWEYYKNNGIINTYICTNCQGKVEMAIDVEPSRFKYCPNCGANMRGDIE